MKLNELKELAQKATPGPWKHDDGNHQIETSGHRILICDAASNFTRKVDAEYMYGENIPDDVNGILKYDNDDDMEFISAANPQVVIQLIERIEKLSEALTQISIYAAKAYGIGTADSHSFNLGIIASIAHKDLSQYGADVELE